MFTALRTLKPVLAACTAPTEIREGSKHLKIYVGGKMCSVISRNNDNRSQTLLRNVIADIRRADRNYVNTSGDCHAR